MLAVKMSSILTFLLFVMCLGSCADGGMLFPRESESRSIQDLCGMWEFRADMSLSRTEGMDKQWYKKPLSEVG